MEVFAPRKCTQEEYKAVLEQAAEQSSSAKPNMRCIRCKVTVTKGPVNIVAHCTFVFNMTEKVAYIHSDQIRHFSDPEFTALSLDKIPTLQSFIREQRGVPSFIREQRGVPIELPFTSEARRAVFVPMNKSVAAGVVLAFFNGDRDPVEKILSIYGSGTGETADEINRVMTTYYLCCLKYITDVNFDTVVAEGQEEHITYMLDDQSCVPTVLQAKYEKLKDTRFPIPQGILAFHAVYGAYVLCRPVANKTEFRLWITKRYSAFLSSIQQASENAKYLDLQNGGSRVNQLAVSRPTLRKAVYSIVKGQYEDIRTAAVKTHVKMLTALSEMTTYALVNRVLATGGNVILLKPLTAQVIKFLKEKRAVEEILESEGFTREEIIYIHLFKPHFQCFRAADYADLVQTAFVIEEYLDPKNKSLERYRAKTDGVTVNIKQVRAFLNAQTSTLSCALDEKTKEELREHYGGSVDDMVKDAEQVMKIVTRQSRLD